jgi:hypothetical protein
MGFRQKLVAFGVELKKRLQGICHFLIRAIGVAEMGAMVVAQNSVASVMAKWIW